MKRIFLLCLAVMLSGTALADNHSQPTVYGQYLAIVVSDPDAVVAAMQKYRQSPTGQKLSSNVTLSANLANGTDQATHTIAVFYPSAAAMQADMDASRDSSDRAALMSAMRNASSIEAENVFTQTMAKINDETLGGAGGATMLFGLTVFDNARYQQALETILGSDAAAAFPGNMFSGQVVAMGEVPGTHWVSFQSKDVGTLLSGVETFMNSSDFANYAKDASEFRRVEGRYISRTILALGPQ
jgi:hypothetical protein